MKVYRIYKMVVSAEYDYYSDDYRDVEEDITIKYVSSKEKADAFLKERE